MNRTQRDLIVLTVGIGIGVGLGCYCLPAAAGRRGICCRPTPTRLLTVVATTGSASVPEAAARKS